MPDDPEIKRILGQILAKLEITGEGTASELISEVRNALRDAGEPTVSSSIRDLKTTMSHEFQILRDHLSNAGGRLTGGTAPSRDDGGHAELSERMTGLLTHLDDVLDRLERATVSFERLGGHAAGIGGAPRPYQEREVYLSAITAVEKLWKTGTTASEVWSSFSTLIKEQTIASLKAMATSLFDVGLNLNNLGTQFRNLRNVLGKEIGELSSGGVFGSNALGPMEFFLEGPKRAMDGVLFETDSFRTALKSVRGAIENDMVSPLSLTGRSVTELAGDFHKARQDMREKFSFDSRGWMSTDEANRSLQDMLEFQKRAGVSGMNTAMEAAQATAEQNNFLRIIATMTGQTVGELEKQTQANRQQLEVMMGQGRMNGEEAQMFAQMKTGLEGRLGKRDGDNVADALSRLTAFGRDRNQILGNPDTPQTLKNLFATVPETMNSMLAARDAMMRPLRAGETNETRLDEIKNLVAQFPRDLNSFNQMGRNNAPLQGAVFGPETAMLSKLYNAGNIAAGVRAPDKAQTDTREQSEVFSFIQMMKEWWREQASPFLGLPAAITANTIAIAANTAAILFSMRGGLLSSIASMLTPGIAGAGAAAKFAGKAAVGTVGLGLGAYDVYSNFHEGNKEAGYGGLVGAGAGAVVGGAIGTLTDWFTGPFGTIMGAAIGEQIGSALGGWFSSGKEKPKTETASPTQTAASGPPQTDVQRMVAEYQQQAKASLSPPPSAPPPSTPPPISVTMVPPPSGTTTPNAPSPPPSAPPPSTPPPISVTVVPPPSGTTTPNAPSPPPSVPPSYAPPPISVTMVPPPPILVPPPPSGTTTPNAPSPPPSAPPSYVPPPISVTVVPPPPSGTTPNAPSPPPSAPPSYAPPISTIAAPPPPSYAPPPISTSTAPPPPGTMPDISSADNVADAIFIRFRPYLDLIGKQPIIQGSSPNMNIPSANNNADAVFALLRPYLEHPMVAPDQNSTPAVSPPTNNFGPQAEAVAASTNSTYQDSSLSLMTQIIQTGAQGNYILGQMYGELTRQTGYLSGNPSAGGGISYNGQGLAVNVAPVVTGTRPSDANPYVGPGA